MTAGAAEYKSLKAEVGAFEQLKLDHEEQIEYKNISLEKEMLEPNLNPNLNPNFYSTS